MAFLAYPKKIPLSGLFLLSFVAEIEPLLEGWHERWSKSKSKVYYANKATGETRWDRLVRPLFSDPCPSENPLFYGLAVRRPTSSSLAAPPHGTAKSIAGSSEFGAKSVIIQKRLLLHRPVDILQKN
jgi:hypothetical protein